MAHLEQQLFLKLIVQHSEVFLNAYSVLEIGSYDVNGTARSVFEGNTSYLGVDLVSGPCVDIVYDGEILQLDGVFDFVFCCEVFEHDKNWTNTFKNMVNYCSTTGVVVFTCASKGRAEHGTSRTDPTHSPGSQAIGWDYYKNLQQSDFEKAFNLNEFFSSYFFYYEPNNCDLYFFGTRDKNCNLEKNDIIPMYQRELRKLKDESKPPRSLKLYIYEALRLITKIDYPLRTMLLFQKSEKNYQNYLLFRDKILIYFSKLVRRILILPR